MTESLLEKQFFPAALRAAGRRFFYFPLSFGKKKAGQRKPVSAQNPYR